MDEARAWLEARRAFGMALGLDTTRRLLVALDRPDLRTSTVLHVAEHQLEDTRSWFSIQSINRSEVFIVVFGKISFVTDIDEGLDR